MEGASHTPLSVPCLQCPVVRCVLAVRGLFAVTRVRKRSPGTLCSVFGASGCVRRPVGALAVSGGCVCAL
eukprot:9795328-Alexandrium_andersonii.AAC.1